MKLPPRSSRPRSPEPAQGPDLQRRTALAACAGALGLLLPGCGGGGTDGAVGAAAEGMSAQSALAAALSAGLTSPVNGGVLDPGLLLMMVPDDTDAADPRIAAWEDAASENGVRLLAVTDSQFAGLGDLAFGYAGLVLPDDLHSIATDDTIAMVRSYVERGGSIMLTFDFGALTRRDDGAVVYPIPRSRLSDVAGVEYVLYDELLDRTTGIGPIVGVPSTLRALQVPPGKSMPYGAATALSATAAARTADPLYLPVSPADPGGVRGFDPQQMQSQPAPGARDRRNRRMRKRANVNFGRAVRRARVQGVTRARPAQLSVTTAEPQAALLAVEAEPLHAYTGYLIGELQYPTYVTRGAYAGQTLLNAPDFGLVAGAHTFGEGQVLFVNLPLTYLKGRTDALPMHGLLGYFAHQMLRLPHLSAMPNGIGGMVFNWHLDSMEAQAPSLALESEGVFQRGPFSIDMTAGPDTVLPGDGLGWNLNNNSTAQALLRRLHRAGHAVGSHGGWIHDYYGGNATEDNRTTFEPYITMNMTAVNTVIGANARGYSAPEGNNPLWAMDYLEAQGVVGAYFGGHTGLGGTRHYREGTLRNPGLHVFPVTPNGLYATFDEFQEFAQSKASVIAWYRAMVDFCIDWNTNRMVYAHPPAAYEWRDVLRQFLNYAANKGTARFRWYTMPQLADFMASRRQVAWTQTVLPGGAVQFNASHPGSLGQMVWRLPKSRFQRPVIASGATLAENPNHWLVRGRNMTSCVFSAQEVA